LVKNRKETSMLHEGDNAPAFSLPDQNGKIHKLADYKGRWIILYFYPKDMTPGCTTEACNFRDNYTTFTKQDVAILGISKDSPKRHSSFSTKYDLPFPLLSDEGNNVAETYGVWKEKSQYGRTYMGIARTTFLINPQQKIAKIYAKVDVKEHAREILTDLKNSG
jgi:peroxiredoxin Q/BCP